MLVPNSQCSAWMYLMYHHQRFQYYHQQLQTYRHRKKYQKFRLHQYYLSMPCQNHEKALQCSLELYQLHHLQSDRSLQRLQNHMLQHHRYTLRLKDYWHPEHPPVSNLSRSALHRLPSSRSALQSHRWKSAGHFRYTYQHNDYYYSTSVCK